MFFLLVSPRLNALSIGLVLPSVTNIIFKIIQTQSFFLDLLLLCKRNVKHSTITTSSIVPPFPDCNLYYLCLFYFMSLFTYHHFPYKEINLLLHHFHHGLHLQGNDRQCIFSSYILFIPQPYLHMAYQKSNIS